jgi:thiol-disulfide isomerase/thioredoxin
MKKVVFVFCFTFAAIISNAQTFVDPVAPYQKDSLAPVFNLILTNGKDYSDKQLPKNKPIVFIYFSPDCGHCQVEAEHITKEMKLIEEAFYVWVSYRDMEDIKAFGEKYKFSDYNNMVIGRDPAYAIPSFFRVRFTPFVAVYNKERKLIQTFESGATVDQLKHAIKN